MNIRLKLKKINQAIYHRFNILLHRDGEDFQHLRFFNIKTCEWLDETFPLAHLDQKKPNQWVKDAAEAMNNNINQ
jgi:hypothetical protein